MIKEIRIFEKIFAIDKIVILGKTKVIFMMRITICQIKNFLDDILLFKNTLIITEMLLLLQVFLKCCYRDSRKLYWHSFFDK